MEPQRAQRSSGPLQSQRICGYNAQTPTQGEDGLCGHAYLLIPCEGEHSDDKGCAEDEDATVAVRDSHARVNPSARRWTSTKTSTTLL